MPGVKISELVTDDIYAGDIVPLQRGTSNYGGRIGDILATLAFASDANTLITPSTPILMDQATGDEAALTLDYTTNKAAGNDTGLLINQTHTLSNGTSNLLDLQVGGVSKVTASAAGDVNATGAYQKDGVTILDTDSTLFNVAVGEHSLSDALLTGANNTALGHQSLYNNESGYSNVATGWKSLHSNTTGHSNIASGDQSLYSNVEGDYNVATGYQSLYSNVGSDLFSNYIGHHNVATGYQSLYSNTDSYNVAVGSSALGLKAGGNYNVAVGDSAGRYQSGGRLDLTDAARSVFIGREAKGVDAATNQIVIGSAAEGLGSNTTVLGSSATTLTRLQGNVDTDGAYQKDGVTILDTNPTSFNTAVGEGALSDALLTGANNTATGYQSLYSNIDGDYNVASGFQSLYNNTSGVANIASGRSALFSNVDGDYNIASGYQSLYSNTSGVGNTAAGFQSLHNNLGGNYNVATGHRALFTNASGSTNIALSREALFYNATGSDNFAAGFQSLFNNVSGAYNVAISREALRANTTGSYNVAAGYRSLYNNVSGNYNIASGYQSLFSNTGLYNVGVGPLALYSQAGGAGNTALGYYAGRYQPGGTLELTDANHSVFIGFNCKGVDLATNQIVIGKAAEGLGSNTTVLGSTATTLTRLQGNVDTDGAYQRDGVTILDTDSTLFNVAVGEGALSDALLAGVRNTATGYQSLYSNTTGNYNVATGFECLYSNVGGAYNVATGYRSLYNNTTGTGNIATGYQSLYNNVDGHHNIASGGFQSLFNNVDGDYNVAAGYQSLYANTSGSQNLAISREALRYNTTGDYNVAAGYRALYQNVGGSNNVAVGRSALQDNVSGDSNVAAGYASMVSNVSGVRNSALGYVSFYGLTSGDNNVAVGSGAGRYQSGGTVALTDATNSIFIGPTSKGVNTATNQIVIGSAANGLGSNTTVLGSTATTLTRVFGKLALGKDTASTPIHVYEDNASSGTANGITIEQDGAGDSILQFLLTGTRRWMMGIDNDDGDKFKIDEGTGLTSAAAFTIDTSSNVGIGTASPGGLLHLFAGTAIGAAAPSPASGDNLVIEDSGDNFINLLTSVGDISGIYFSDASRGRGQITYDHASDALRFATLTNERLRITSTGNVGIGTASPNANAILDVNSTTQAFLPPRMTTAQKNLVAAPTAGMVVYDTTLGKLAVHTGAGWETITSA